MELRSDELRVFTSRLDQWNIASNFSLQLNLFASDPLSMELSPGLDRGSQIAKDLADIHRVFATADEVYREFRLMIMLNGCGSWPTEWIPISDD